MAVFTVGPSSTYASFPTALSAAISAHTDPDTHGEEWRFQMEAFTDTVSAQVTISSSLSTSSYGIFLEPQDGAHHGGDKTAGYKMIQGNTAFPLMNVQAANVTIRGIVLSAEDGTSNDHTVLVTGAGAVLEEVIAIATSNANCGAFELFASAELRSCLALDAAYGFYPGSTGVTLINCGADNCTTGYLIASATHNPIAKNCWAASCTTGFDTEFRSDSDVLNGSYNCASDDDTHPNANGGVSIVTTTGVDFVNFGAGDYTPTDTGALYKAGVNPNTESSTSDDWLDITGQQRAYWDIGAYAAPGSLASTNHKQTIVVRKDKTDSLTDFPHYLPLDRLNTAFWDGVAARRSDFGAEVLPSGWTVRAGTFNYNAGYTSATGATAGTGNLLTRDGSADGEVTARLSTTIGASQAAGVVFRYSDTDNFLLADIEPNGGKARIFKREAGAWTELASAFFTPTASQYYDLRATFSGSALALYIDGTQYVTATNSFNQSATTVGLRADDETARFARFDFGVFGSDIRIFKDGVECPREVVSCDPVGKTGEVWFKADSSNMEDNLYDIYVDGSSPDYAVTAAFGRNAVWSDYDLVMHMEDATDSSGNYSPVNSGATFANGGAEFDGVSDLITMGSPSANQFDNVLISVDYLWNTDTANAEFFSAYQADGRVIRHRNEPTEGRGNQLLVGTSDGTAYSGRVYSTTIPSTGVRHTSAIARNGSTVEIFEDGAGLSETVADTIPSTNTATPAQMDIGENLDGTIYSLKVRSTVPSSASDWISAEYENQSSPDTFYDFGTDSADLTHVADITINSSEVSGDLTDYTVAIIPDSGSGWDSLWSNVDPDGSDLRFYKDGGAVELAAEIVSMDVAGESAEIHTKYRGTLPSDTDTVIKVYAGATDSYVPRHGFGRNRVWSDYAYVSHDGGATNVVGNESLSGSRTGSASGVIGEASTFGSSQGYVDASTNTVRMQGGDFTLQAWVKTDNFNFTREVLNAGQRDWDKPHIGIRIATDGGIGFTIQDNYTGGNGLSGKSAASTVSAGEWFLLSGSFDRSGDASVYKNDTNVLTQDITGQSGTNSRDMMGIMARIRSNGAADYQGQGDVDEVRIAYRTTSASWIATEHSNQSAPNTFYTVSDPNAVGGGVSVTPGADTVSFTGFAPTVTAGGAIEVNVPADTITFSGFAPTVSVSDNQSVDVPAGAVDLTGHAPTVTATDNQEVSVPAATVTVTGYVPDIQVADGQTVFVPAGTVTVTGHAPTVSTSDNITVEVPAAAVTLQGYAPEVGTSVTITPDAGDMTITGYAPTASASVKSVTCTLVNATGAALPNLVDLSYAWFDEPDPANLSTPVVTGVTESTDGSGVIEVDVNGSSLASGQTGLLVLRSQDGTSLGAYNLAIQ